MKRRRDNKSQKITAFLSSAPPTKRASGIEDGGVPSSSSSEDWNQPTSSEQRERERQANASANTANIRQAITECGKLITRGYFTLMARVCIASFAESLIQ